MRSWFRRSMLAAAVLAVGGCYNVDAPFRPDLSSFRVTVRGVMQPRTSADGKVKFGDPGTPLPVVSACRAQYGNEESQVPAEVRGTDKCPYAIPRGEVDLDVEVVALDKKGQPLEDFSGPVAFKVAPGDLTQNYGYRWMQVQNGFGQGVIKVSHLYSEVRVWVSDEKPEPIFQEGEVVVNDDLPAEPELRTNATGVSAVVRFEDPTLAAVQVTDGFDNTSSPLVGQFLTIGRPPLSGSPVLESCPDDPEHDGKEAMMVVTGIDPSGFFVTDLNACRLKEVLTDSSGASQVRVPEPSGFYPGTWGSMFIYNYSFPDGLDQGDLLWSVSGAVQEFTSTTQLTFPSWNLRDHVRAYKESEWNKYLSQVPIPEVNLRVCGLDDKPAPFVTDVLCAHNKRSLKMESLESALVRLKNVKFSTEFVNCDKNGDGSVPFFCEQKNEQGAWVFGDCTNFDGSGSTLSAVEQEELACNIACVAGQDQVCSEKATYTGFGQFVAELSGPGPAAANLDDSLPSKIETFPVGTTPVQSQTPVWEGAELRLFCNAPVHYAFGDAVNASNTDPLLPANTVLDHFIGSGEPHLSVVLDGDSSGAPGCSVALNTHTKINLITKDAIPELKVDCDPNDADPEAAQQCQNLRGARFDVIGHVRQVQPARPRWVVLPRDKDDVCCYPGPGLECPKPIAPCH